MQTFCTIVTASHFALATVLGQSIQKHFPNVSFYVLITDDVGTINEDNLNILHPKDLIDSQYYQEIEKKYRHTNADHFRWALKPVLINYLLHKNYDKVIFADPDTYFVNNAPFFFELLDTYAVLLTPHWAEANVETDFFQIQCSLTRGFFNAGFVAASRGGIDAMLFWASLCSYKMEKNTRLGFYDDQKYLDFIAAQYEGVHILHHKGCNVASWNRRACKRTKEPDGTILINNSYPVIFIHFAKDMTQSMEAGKDPLLIQYFEEYKGNLTTVGGLHLLTLKLDSIPKKVNNLVYKIKHRLRIRTRIKKFITG
jgi:hypothetical protein